MKRQLITLAVVVTAAAGLVALRSCFEETENVVSLLIGGWTNFLARVLPQVTVEGWGILTGLVCVGLLAVGLRWFLKRWRWGLAVLAVVVLLFVAGTALVGLGHQVARLAASPEPFGIHGPTARAESQSNLKLIGYAVHVRATDRQNQVRGTIRQDQLPGSIVDAHGSILHGWQAQLVPYVDSYAAKFYRSVDRTLPWDHPANKEPYSVPVEPYLHPSLRPGKFWEGSYPPSHYAGNVHILGRAQPLRLGDIQREPGLSNVILAGEIAENIRPWGYPPNWRDPRLGIKRSPEGFGSPITGPTHFLMGDGSVRAFTSDTNPEVLESLSYAVPKR